MNPIDKSLHTTLSSYEWLPLVFSTMSTDLCPLNCSGSGYCENGQCVCLVQYSGRACQDKNVGYFIAFGSIYASLTAVVLVQLILSLRTEFLKQKTRSYCKLLLKMNAHKLLYFVTFLASSIRCIYFFTKWNVPITVSSKLWSAYFPFLLSGFTYLVCFWAEAYHLSNIKFTKPRFLSKSFIGFIMGNTIVYMVLAVQLTASLLLDDHTMLTYVLKACNAFFAFMMILAVIFFLIYGVLMYFKIKGAFTQRTNSSVDLWTLHMSRLGLVAQAAMQFIMALLILCDITKELWLEKLPILSQNFYDIGFRIVEFGVVLWFPCVLWNYKSPENLWVLNPMRLFKHLDFQDQRSPLLREDSSTGYGSISQQGDMKYDCWICYDADRVDAGPLIQPCECRGDVASVHHECLRKWLMECVSKDDELKCKVCNNYYKLKQRWGWMPRGLNARHWLQTFCVIIIMVGAPFAAYAITHSVIIVYIRVMVIGLAILIELVCMRVLARSLGICYRHSQLSTVLIEGKEVVGINVDKLRTCIPSKRKKSINNQRDTGADPCLSSYNQRDIGANPCVSSCNQRDIGANPCVSPYNKTKPCDYNNASMSTCDRTEDSNLEDHSGTSVRVNQALTSSREIAIPSHNTRDTITSQSQHSRGFSFSVEAVIETTSNRSVH